MSVQMYQTRDLCLLYKRRNALFLLFQQHVHFAQKAFCLFLVVACSTNLVEDQQEYSLTL